MKQKTTAAMQQLVPGDLPLTFCLLLAIVIAIPLAWTVMIEWLRGFVYRMSLGPWIFAAAGLAALGLAMATVGVQAVKAAMANPVDSLRSAID